MGYLSVKRKALTKGNIIIVIPNNHFSNTMKERSFEHNFGVHMAICTGRGECVHLTQNEQTAIQLSSIDEFTENKSIIVLELVEENISIDNIVSWIESQRKHNYCYDLEKNITSGICPYEIQFNSYCSHFILNAFWHGGGVKLLEENQIVNLKDYPEYVDLWYQQPKVLMKVLKTPNQFTLPNYSLWCVLPLSFLDSKYLKIKYSSKHDLVKTV